MEYGHGMKSKQKEQKEQSHENTLLTIALLFCLFSIQAQDTTYISLDKLLQQVETIIPLSFSINTTFNPQAKADGAKSWMPPTFSTGIMRFPLQCHHDKG